MKPIGSIVLVVAVVSLCTGQCVLAQTADSRIEVRQGYRLSLAVPSLDRARFMALAPDGTLFVSQPHVGEIKACRDRNRDGVYESISTFVSGHRTVHGLLWHEGWLWFTETGAIFKGRDTDGDGAADEEQTVIPQGRLPRGGGHWWRSILIHNGRLYTSIGCSGNITDDSSTERMKIWSFDLAGGDKKLFASGLRNTEKFVVRPGTDEIWGMDHGSDWFGGEIEGRNNPHGQPITDLNPPDEMNLYVEGGFYGHPFIVASKLPRYEYMRRPDIVELAAKTISPAWPTGAHWAPNAMVFYAGAQFPQDCRGDAFVAYHGSWNRSRRSGYCVTRVLFDQGRPYGELVYVSFVLDSGQVLGRPVDVVVAPDGSLLISDDEGDRVYRLSFVGQSS
ncbi:MAG: PQQ-dependent sugar dehydrogenase [Sedimentisphaerales bacterium]|nr:PQQ-dependent sugar dehydrogenase [Sedimentisphaerales bacterium]